MTLLSSRNLSSLSSLGDKSSGPVDLFVSNLSRYFFTSYSSIVPSSRDVIPIVCVGGALGYGLGVLDREHRQEVFVIDFDHLSAVRVNTSLSSFRAFCFLFGSYIREEFFRVGLGFACDSLFLMALTLSNESSARSEA